MVKRVLTNIITVGVLMGSLVACGDSNSSLIEVDAGETRSSSQNETTNETPEASAQGKVPETETQETSATTQVESTEVNEDSSGSTVKQEEPVSGPEESGLLSDQRICGESGSGPIFGFAYECERRMPVWSPDGQHVYFIDENWGMTKDGVYTREEESGIYRIDIDGSNLSKILGIDRYPGDSILHRDISISPNGEQIAFVEVCRGCLGTMWTHEYLHLADSNGTNRGRVADERGNPVWIADGESLLASGGNVYSSATYVINPTEGTASQLPALGERQEALIASPDGTLIAGIITDTVTGAYDGKRLFIMSIDGSSSSILEQDEDTFIDKPKFWSTDGQHIIFDRFIFSESGEFMSGRLGEREPEQLNPVQVYEFQYDVIRMIMDIDTLTARPLNESERLKYQDGISPDGTKVVFAKIVNGSSEIFIRDADGTNVKQLTFSDK